LTAQTTARPPLKPDTTKPGAPPDKELLRVLNEWDDKDADTLAASKARLDALGPDTFDQLATLLRRRARLCRCTLWFACFTFSLLAVIVACWSIQHDTRQPLPYFLNCTLVLLCAIVIISFFAAPVVIAGKLPVIATKAIAEQTTGQCVGVLAELANASGAFNIPTSTITKAALLKTINNLLTNGSASDLQFTEYQRRCLRRMLLTPSRYTDLISALIRLFTRLEDRSVLPSIRRLAAKSRNWEVREAAQDYVARIAPEEAVESNGPGALLEAQLFSDTAEGVNTDNIPALVMALGSRSDVERRAAETMIRRMGPEQIRQVLLLLDQEPDTHQRRRDRVTIIAVMLATSLLNSAWFPLLLRLPYFDNLLAVKAMFGLMVIGLSIGWLIGMDIVRWRRNGRRARQLGFRRVGVFPERRLLDTLQTLDNITLVGTLADALPGVTAEMSSLTNSETNRAMRTALTHLLPRLQASDARLLNTAQRARLNQELARGRQALNPAWDGTSRVEARAALDVAILKAWEQVGDEHALPIVQKLAAQSARTSAQKKVQQAAQSCLPYLEARAGEQRATQTLLRAADTPTESGNVLLRAAASGTTQTDSTQLLRANASEE